MLELTTWMLASIFFGQANKQTYFLQRTSLSMFSAIGA
jgi:hypothetical protein